MRELIIEKLDHKGRGIVRVNGIPIFVENALPGECVEVKVINEMKGYKEAVVTKYVKLSEDRVQPLCPYYTKCGGCDIMHLNYESQLKYKEGKIVEILSKYKINTIVNSIIFDKQYGYRNKITLKVKDNVGLYKKRSNDIVYLDKCLLVNDEINDVIKRLNKIELNKVSEIVIKEADNRVLMNITSKGTKQISVPVSGFYANNRHIDGYKYLIKELDGFKYNISPLSFFQVNYTVMIKLYEKIKEYCSLTGQEKVLDLFCGSGTIGMYLAAEASEVVGVEINKNSLIDAKINVKNNNITNMKFILGDTDKVVKKIKGDFDIVIVDPPRAGLDKNTISWIIDKSIKKVVYVSCDPMTLGRDLSILSEHYNILGATPFDMFPNTHHVETVCVLVRK